MSNIFIEKLGPPGKLISGSKSGYRSMYPTHFVIFNANVCTASQGKIWYGDLDLHLDKGTLMEIAHEMGTDLYILYEMDGRFENEENPLIEKTPVIFHPDKSYTITKEYRTYYKSLEE